MNFLALEAISGHRGTYAFVILLGALWGSFANVCIYRWPPSDEFPHGRSVVAPGSHCFVCKAPVRWYDNVPLLSYLWLRGKCRDCGTGFSPRYLIVEALLAILFGVAWHLAMAPGAAATFDLRLVVFAVYAAFMFFLVVVTFIDLDHMLILDKTTYPAMVVFYAGGLALGHVWWHGIVGAAVGAGIIIAVRAAYYLVRKREGLGLGDAKFLAVVGALWGWQGVIASLFLGSMAGSLIGIATLVFLRATPDAPPGEALPPEPDAPVFEVAAEPGLGSVALPFGPFLAAGALAYLILHPYLRVSMNW